MGDANCVVARAAAEINREANRSLISVAQGIYQSDDEWIQETEIGDAFRAAEDANKIYPGTVWGLIFFNLHVENEDNGEVTLAKIKQYKAKATASGLKIGTRIRTCGGYTNGGGKADLTVKRYVDDIALVSDFIMCNLSPAEDFPDLSVAGSVKEVARRYW
jgi:hypothetical protein